jgi:RNA polymerase sigma factor (sigma-70 family)
MPHPALSAALARASRSINSSSESEMTDGGLLTRFIQTKDETAFAELVRRLGPMVLGVCRRITRDNHLAEDAFQAAFVVLARRASDIRPREGSRGWLYGVAVRTAKRARAVSIHRNARELGVSSLPDRPAELIEPPDADAIRLLDEEVGALPDHLRVAVVLCELEGQSRKEVAGRLGIPEGTLSSRLAAARKRLADRLRQRGIVLPTAALTAALAQSASAQPSVALMARAALAATRETIPAHVAALSQGVLRIMFLDKLKTAIPLSLLVAGLLACVTVASVPPQEPPAPPRTPTTRPLLYAATHADPTPAKVEPKPLPKSPNKLLFYRSGHLTLLDPDGKNELKVSEDRGEFHPGDAKLSPDGKLLAVLIQEKAAPAGTNGSGPARKLHVRELTEKEPGTDLEVECQLFTWSPDGTKIATTDFVDGPPDKKMVATNCLVDVKTKEKKMLKLPENHVITDWSRDGKYFLTTAMIVEKDKPTARIYLMNMDGSEHKMLTDGKEIAVFGRISPDGKRILYTTVQPPKEKQNNPRRGLNVLDIASNKTTPVADLPLNGDIQSYCWAPDGKQIAYSWRELHEGKPEDLIEKETESHLVVCDPDGKNVKTIASEKGQGQWIITIGHVDWR